MQLDPHLSPRSANHRPLTPIDFLDRTIGTFPGRKAVVWREESWTYAEFGRIVARFARFLMERGIGRGDVVSVMCPNRPEMLAAHYAVPMVGAVLNSINTRLDQDSIAYILGLCCCCRMTAVKAVKTGLLCWRIHRWSRWTIAIP